MMKNIHVLPTDKPSNLLLCIKDYIEHKDTPAENLDVKGNFRLGLGIYANTDFYQHQNIYITSDEEINVGTFVLDIKNNEVVKSKGKMSKNPYIKKIILTDNKDLIKEGVQAIDDEFLEWFVKNPSCEIVKVGIGFSNEDDITDISTDYEIIIPKEEPLYNYGWCKGNVVLPKEEPKQETLEEAMEKYINMFKNSYFKGGFKFGFEKGAKWQQEQDKNKFSEEEVLQIIKNAFNQGERYGWDTRDSIGNINEMRSKIPFISLEKYLETFKNK